MIFWYYKSWTFYALMQQVNKLLLGLRHPPLSLKPPNPIRSKSPSTDEDNVLTFIRLLTPEFRNRARLLYVEFKYKIQNLQYIKMSKTALWLPWQRTLLKWTCQSWTILHFKLNETVLLAVKSLTHINTTCPLKKPHTQTPLQQIHSTSSTYTILMPL